MHSSMQKRNTQKFCEVSFQSSTHLKELGGNSFASFGTTTIFQHHIHHRPRCEDKNLLFGITSLNKQHLRQEFS